MDEEIDRLIVSVRADTAGFARDVADLRGSLEGGLGDGAHKAGAAIEAGLLRAIRTGKLGFEDLKSVALSVLNQIAASAVRTGLNSLFGGGGSSGGNSGDGGLLSLANSAISALFGSPGRATGGPVSPGQAYVVGERGPELFVPTSSGSIATAGGGGRDVRIAISINAPSGAAPDMLARSSRQVARAVRAALSED